MGTGTMKQLKLCEDGEIIEEDTQCIGNTIDVLPGTERERLSKRVAGILRHFPDRYGVKIDEYGWSSIDEIVNGLRKVLGYKWVRKWHIIGLALHDPKGRFQLDRNMSRIRACYGHSIPVKLIILPEPVPETLIHGTTTKALKNILSNGITPMKRRWVHLTDKPDQAIETSKRHTGRPVLIYIDKECLEKEGYTIYKVARNTFVVERVPSKCIVKIIEKT